MNKPNKFSPEVRERAVTTVMALGLRTTSSASCDECPNRPFLTHFSLSLLAPDRLLCSGSSLTEVPIDRPLAVIGIG